MAAVIGTYNYTYGAGDQHNRVVQFFRPEGPETIQARVFALVDGAHTQTSSLDGNQIDVDMQCLASKVAAFQAGREFNPREKLCDLPLGLQNAIFAGFPPNGSKKIEIENNPGLNFEVVISMEIHDPI